MSNHNNNTFTPENTQYIVLGHNTDNDLRDYRIFDTKEEADAHVNLMDFEITVVNKIARRPEYWTAPDPAKETPTTTSTVTLPDGRVETRTGKGEWPFAICSDGSHADGWGVIRWSRTRRAAEHFQRAANANGAQMIVIEAEVK